MIYLTNIDLSQNELQNAVIHNLNNDLLDKKKGQIWFNTESKTFKYYDGYRTKELSSTEITDNKLDKKPYNNIELINSKGLINYEYFPDNIKNQTELVGEFNASLNVDQTPIGKPEIGWYMICTRSGNHHPNGKPVEIIPEYGYYYNPGDWSFIRKIDGDTVIWDKADNSEAVKSVNNRIGNIYTYRETWLQDTEYGKGDLANFEGIIYLCLIDNNDHEFNPSKWCPITFRIGAGIDFDDFTISHSSFGNEGGSVGDFIKIPRIQYDNMGHIFYAEELELPIVRNKTELNNSNNIVGTELLKEIITEYDNKINILQQQLLTVMQELAALKNSIT